MARSLFGSDGIVPFSEGLAALLTRNAKDFAGIPGLKLDAVGS